MFKFLAIALIKFYQFMFSQGSGFLGGVFGTVHCRFYPSCSVYTAEAISQYGLRKGFVVSLKRLKKCRPFGGEGYDPLFVNSKIKN